MEPDCGALPLLTDDLARLVAELVVNETWRGRPASLLGAGDDSDLDGSVYIGRDFAGRVDQGWGNPINSNDKATVLTGYLDWLLGDTRSAQDVRARLEAGELTGMKLACWCQPEPCHGWILAGFANGLEEETIAWVERVRSYQQQRTSHQGGETP
jgi:hypothetical protein